MIVWDGHSNVEIKWDEYIISGWQIFDKYLGYGYFLWINDCYRTAVVSIWLSDVSTPNYLKVEFYHILAEFNQHYQKPTHITTIEQLAEEVEQFLIGMSQIRAFF